MTIVIRCVNRAEARVLAVPAPICPGRPAHGVPAGLMLPMIMAAAEGKHVLGPDDLRAHLEAGSLKGLLEFTCVPTRMPDIRKRSREDGPGPPPVGAMVVRHLAELAGVEIDSGTL